MPRNDFTTSLKNIRLSMWKERWEDARINIVLRLDRRQNISCLQRRIKQKCCNRKIIPFSDTPSVKIRMASQNCFLGNSAAMHSPEKASARLTFHS